MALTFLQLQNKVLGWLDESSSSTVVLANVKEAITAANAKRAAEREWQFMLDSDTVTLVVGTTEYTLAADINTLLSLYNSTTEVPLTEVPLRHVTPGETVLNGFTRAGRTLTLLFTPAATDTLTYRYYKQPTELSADGDFPDIPYPYSRVLIYDALLELGLYSEDLSPQKLQLWMMKQAELQADLYAAFLDGNSQGAAPTLVSTIQDVNE